MDIARHRAESPPLARQSRSVGRFHRPVAAIAAAPVRRANRAAAGMSYRPETRRALHHHADRAALLALDADAVSGDRRLAAGEKRGDHLEELRLVDWAALQFEIDRNVGRNRRRCRERADVFGRGINGGDELAHIGEIAQGLDAAVRGARADGNQALRLPPYLANAPGIVLGSDRSLDQGQIIGAILHGARRLQKIGDLDRTGEA